MVEAMRIAVLGSECTGKTELTFALRARLAEQTGLRVAAVSEWLRAWCDLHQRTPLQHEQADIAQKQQRQIEAASACHDIVVCDTTALMTAAYSLWYFNDSSLVHAAVAAHKTPHRSADLILLTALDVPWQADGLQRDGDHVREPIDSLLRGLMHDHQLAFCVIGGTSKQRLDSALAATHLSLQRRASSQPSGHGLFGRLLNAPQGEPRAGAPAQALKRRRGAWSCECCVPAAEQASLKQLQQNQNQKGAAGLNVPNER